MKAFNLKNHLGKIGAGVLLTTGMMFSSSALASGGDGCGSGSDGSSDCGDDGERWWW